MLSEQAEVLLSFDFGEQRTGVALGQTITASARPLTTIISDSRHQPNWQQIGKLIRVWQPAQLIVGMPEDLPGNQPLRKKIRRFCRQLAEKSSLPVSTHDETLTSDEAYLQLKIRRQSVKGKINKKDIDQMAAAILLQSWMNANLRQ